MKRRIIGRKWMAWLLVLFLAFGTMSQGTVFVTAGEVSTTESGEEITQSTLNEMYRLWKENGMGNLKVDIDEIQNYKISGNMQSSIEDYKTEADVPIFLVLITDGEGVVGTSAFYVRDTYGTGGTYLVTSALAKIFLDNGYDVILVGQDYAEEITKIHCPDESSLHAYMEAEGVTQYVPLEMAKEIEYDNCGLGFLEIADEEFNLDMDWFDLSTWRKKRRNFL